MRGEYIPGSTYTFYQIIFKLRNNKYIWNEGCPPETIIGGNQKKMSALHADFYASRLSIYTSDATVDKVFDDSTRYQWRIQGGHEAMPPPPMAQP